MKNQILFRSKRIAKKETIRKKLVKIFEQTPYTELKRVLCNEGKKRHPKWVDRSSKVETKLYRDKKQAHA